MIPERIVSEWASEHPWRHVEQVEQDLLLSQGICEIYSDPLLASELVFRGGTAFHKLFLPKPYRYSEDLDFVRRTAGGIGEVMKHLSAIGRNLGYKVNTEMGKYPKVLWRYTAHSAVKGRIKIEINTYERTPVLPLTTRTLVVESAWHTGQQDVTTFQPEEQVATKLRALYQRSKGRDLFDIWLALNVLKVDPQAIATAFPAYKPEGLTQEKMRENLAAKLADYDFCHDCDQLVAMEAESVAYDAQTAGALVDSTLLPLLAS